MNKIRFHKQNNTSLFPRIGIILLISKHSYKTFPPISRVRKGGIAAKN